MSSGFVPSYSCPTLPLGRSSALNVRIRCVSLGCSIVHLRQWTLVTAPSPTPPAPSAPPPPRIITTRTAGLHTAATFGHPSSIDTASLVCPRKRTHSPTSLARASTDTPVHCHSTGWIMTLFTSLDTLPLGAVQCLWDRFLCSDNGWKVVHRCEPAGGCWFALVCVSQANTPHPRARTLSSALARRCLLALLQRVQVQLMRHEFSTIVELLHLVCAIRFNNMVLVLSC